MEGCDNKDRLPISNRHYRMITSEAVVKLSFEDGLIEYLGI